MPAKLTSAVVTVYAVLFMLAGAALIFAPDELAAWAPGEVPPIVLTLLGGALFALGHLDWMSRRAPLGGIYGRPVVLANLVHFMVGGLALVRHDGLLTAAAAYWPATIAYLAGAVYFGLLLVRTPEAARPASA